MNRLTRIIFDSRGCPRWVPVTQDAEIHNLKDYRDLDKVARVTQRYFNEFEKQWFRKPLGKET
jgi:hypothetical protein